jgi:5-methyltetrahydrofolate--homocysteine methyltransferase
MEPITARLKNKEALLADGAMGTILMQRGMEGGSCPEKINLEKPEILEEIARQYHAAGAEIIHTNTFGGSPLKLGMYELGGKMREINVRAIESARKAVDDGACVSGSCGPSGQILEPYGDTSPGAVYESFRSQLTVMIDEGVDMITIETMSDLAEAKLALEAARSLSSSIPVAVTMTYDPTPRGFLTIMGTGVADTVKTLTEAGADIVGSNCGNGTENMVKIAGEFVGQTEVPVMIQSNAGLPEVRGGESVYPETPEILAGATLELIQHGVRIIGGCCGTTPAHIAAMRTVIDQFHASGV